MALRMVQVKLLVFECQTSGTYANRAKHATKKRKLLCLLFFLNKLALLQPAADRALFILHWAVARDTLNKKNCSGKRLE
jgi:hypothetical protein